MSSPESAASIGEPKISSARLPIEAAGFGSANGNRTRISALKGPRANRCTIAPQNNYDPIGRGPLGKYRGWPTMKSAISLAQAARMCFRFHEFDEHFAAGRQRDQKEIHPRAVCAGSRGGKQGQNSEAFAEKA